MNERLVCLGTYEASSDTDADGVWGVYVPAAFRLTGISIFGTVGGAASPATIDIQDDGVDAIAAVDLSTDGLLDSDDFTEAEFAAGSLIEIDLNLTAGTSPVWSGEIAIWGYLGE